MVRPSVLLTGSVRNSLASFYSLFINFYILNVVIAKLWIWAFKDDLANIGRLSETPKKLIVEAGGDALVRAAA